VTFIGSQHSGNMSNNANEGHPGAVIDQITTFAAESLYLLPNIILVMAGTNDMAADIEPDTAPERLGELIDTCVAACPEAVVLVAQVSGMLGGGLARVRVFNDAVPEVVKERTDDGKKVLVVDMESAVGWNLADGLHPNDKGYEKMAEAWVEGIQVAEGKGWIGKGGKEVLASVSGHEASRSGIPLFTGGAIGRGGFGRSFLAGLMSSFGLHF
jgi:lysophospholipase L1-like esterase